MGLCASGPGVDASTGAPLLNKDDFTVESIINEGGYGTVYKGVRKHDQLKVALKFFGYTENKPFEQEIDMEIRLMLSLNGFDGCVNLYGIFKDTVTGLVAHKKFPTRAYKVMVLELCEGGDLFDRIIQQQGKISERILAKSFKSAMLALNGLHSGGYIHRDLKTENVIAVSNDPDSELKLIDFGMVARLKANEEILIDPERVGTPGNFFQSLFSVNINANIQFIWPLNHSHMVDTPLKVISGRLDVCFFVCL
jgi:calcium-dependent protein kinase